MEPGPPAPDTSPRSQNQLVWSTNENRKRGEKRGKRSEKKGNGGKIRTPGEIKFFKMKRNMTQEFENHFNLY